MLAKKLLAILEKGWEEENRKNARITIAKLFVLTTNAINSLNMLWNMFKDQNGDALFYLNFIILVKLSQSTKLFSWK